MTTEINYELAKVDGDYLVKVTIGDCVKAIGKTLVAPTGEFIISDVVVQLNKFSVTKDGKEYNFPLMTVAQNILNGKMSVK